jgi:hypothetical protein
VRILYCYRRCLLLLSSRSANGLIGLSIVVVVVVVVTFGATTEFDALQSVSGRDCDYDSSSCKSLQQGMGVGR